MATLADLITRARVTLQDTSSVRYTDAELLVFVNEALGEARRARPDFFLGSYSTAQTSLASGATFPLPFQYEQFAVDYIAGRAEMRESESTNEGRAAALLSRFKAGLNGL